MLLNYIFMKLRLWTHKDIFDYEIVWSAITWTNDLKDAQETYLGRNDDKKMPKADKIKVRHDTREKLIADRKKCLAIAKEKKNKEEIKFWTAMLEKKIYDLWWWKGIRYKRRSIIDRIRRYFFLSCYCVLEVEREDRNYLSRHWFEICDFFERLETYFYYKLDR